MTTSRTPVIQTPEHPIQFESCGDPVTEASEQTAASKMEADVLPPSPVADLAASSPPNLSEPAGELVPVRRYVVRVRKPQLCSIYELCTDIKTAYFNKHVVFDLNFQNFISYHIALASGDELRCIGPEANACAHMRLSEMSSFESKT